MFAFGQRGTQRHRPFPAGRRRRRRPNRFRTSLTVTLTSVFSLAVPLKVGVVLFDRSGGWANVTSGARVLTSKLRFRCSRSGSLEAALLGRLRRERVFPDGSSLLSAAPLVDQWPPDAVVFADATSVAPSMTCTVTSVFSLAVPSKDGFLLFEGDGGATIVTTGASVLTSKLTVSLFPFGFPMPLFSVAFAVNVCLPDGSSLLSAAPLVDQWPPDAVVFADATSVAPSMTCTVTSVFSLAVPSKDGFLLFEGDGGAQSSRPAPAC